MVGIVDFVNSGLIKARLVHFFRADITVLKAEGLKLCPSAPNPEP